EAIGISDREDVGQRRGQSDRDASQRWSVLERVRVVGPVSRNCKRPWARLAQTANAISAIPGEPWGFLKAVRPQRAGDTRIGTQLANATPGSASRREKI